MNKTDIKYIYGVVSACAINPDSISTKDIEIMVSLFLSDLESYFKDNEDIVNEIREFRNIKGV